MSQPRCEWTHDVPAWLQGELSAERGVAVAEHVEQCAQCQLAQRDLTGLLSELQMLPGNAWSPGSRWARRLRVWTPAAALLLALGVGLAWPTSDAEPPSPPLEPRAEVAAVAGPVEARWLVAELQPDGSWPADLLGPTRQQLSQHALALLALAQADADPAAVGRAADWLVARQRADGSFSSGLADGSTDQALAAAALQQAARRTGRDDLDGVAQRAVDHLLDLLGQGGRPAVTHPAQLAWVVEALEGARASGRQDVLASLERVCRGRTSVRPACDVAALRRDAVGSARGAEGLGPVVQASLATLAAAGW